METLIMLFPAFLAFTKPEQHLSLEIFAGYEGKHKVSAKKFEGLVNFKGSFFHNSLKKKLPTMNAIVPPRYSFKAFVRKVLTDEFDTQKLVAFRLFASTHVPSLMKVKTPGSGNGEEREDGAYSSGKKMNKEARFKNKVYACTKDKFEYTKAMKILELTKDHVGEKPLVRRIYLEPTELGKFYRDKKGTDVMKELNQLLGIQDAVDDAESPKTPATASKA